MKLLQNIHKWKSIEFIFDNRAAQPILGCECREIFRINFHGTDSTDQVEFQFEALNDEYIAMLIQQQ
jgi:hypothetical protein